MCIRDSVVTYENCSGAKSIDKLVDEENPDVYDALARRYIDIGCSVMTPNPNRLELLDRLIDEYKVDGVVEMTLQACHTYTVSYTHLDVYKRQDLQRNQDSACEDAEGNKEY